MPKGYTHLAYEQRCQIYALLKRGMSQNQIAKDIGMSQSSINREIKRNSGKKGYRYKQAQKKADGRRLKVSSQPKKMIPQVISLIESLMREKQWSPEQISGWLKKNRGIFISIERIYRHIWQDKSNKGTLYKNLRRSAKKYNKRANKLAGRGLIPNRIGIENRPKIVDAKVRVGDYEMDTIIGSRHRGAIVSVTERKTKLAKLYLVNQPTAEATSDAVIKQLLPFRKYVHTLTADNGKEFSQHRRIANKLHAQVYFAQPYHAWERGLNENTNGLVRQYFPKKTDFTKLTQDEVQRVEDLLNSRPRKTLNFRTPNEVFLELTGIINKSYALRS
jgi:IS30 family transposase